MNTYKLSDCEFLITKYVNEFQGEVLIIEEGCLGLGTVLLHSAAGKKCVLIREIYLNEWSSSHTIRKYNKLPKKYQKLVDTQ